MFGLATIAVSVLMVVVIPDSPMTYTFLSRDEKIWAIERLRKNETGIEIKHFKAYQAWECVKDPQTWLMSPITISSNLLNGAASSYQASKGFGYASKETALLSVLSATFLAGRYNTRDPSIIAYCRCCFRTLVQTMQDTPR